MNIVITPEAREALSQHEVSALRLRIAEDYTFEMLADSEGPDDRIVDCGGVRIILDPTSAARADGTRIDFVTAPHAGFVVDHPKRAVIRQLSAPDLKAWLSRGDACLLIDVRTDTERSLACIEGSRLLDKACHDALLELPRDTAIVFQCHHGVRSQNAAEYFLAKGFTNLFNLVGGIDAWSLQVDPSVPRY
ncbi:MAG: rhodanese-like domain-containing protein [Vicinamibacterales bacterium]